MRLTIARGLKTLQKFPSLLWDMWDEGKHQVPGVGTVSQAIDSPTPAASQGLVNSVGQLQKMKFAVPEVLLALHLHCRLLPLSPSPLCGRKGLPEAIFDTKV